MSIFKIKKTGEPRNLELSMVGVKLGSNVLQLDGKDGDLIAAMAGVVGLSGQACAVAQTHARANKFRRVAAAAGVLVEVKVASLTALPYESGSFDLVVIKRVLGELDQNDRVGCLQQVFQMLRHGGRCLVIDPAMRGGLGAIFTRQSLNTWYVESGGAQQALKAEGFLGVRKLAERDGQVFIEGTKPAGDDDTPIKGA